MGAIPSDAMTVCKALAAAGIWIDLRPADQQLILGPTPAVQAHPELLQQVRDHKAAMLAILQESLVYELLAQPDSGRFALEQCPDCQQSVFLISPPRRLAVHRLPETQAVCPGAVRAQEGVAHLLMTRFIAARCLQRPGAVLTWMALKGGLEGWAREEGLLLPPRPYLLGWMDQHYQRMSQDAVYASWRGMTFTLQEWLGDDEGTPPTAAPVAPKRKTVLRA